MQHTRNSTLDICKFIAMFLVIWLHFGAPHVIDVYLHLFHMPVFFFLSGLCYNEIKHNNFKQLITSRVQSLIKPYVLVAIVMYIFWTIIHLLFIPERTVPIEIFIRSLCWTNTTAVLYLCGVGTVVFSFIILGRNILLSDFPVHK